MRGVRLIIATSAAMAVLTQTAGAYASGDETSDPSTAVVLSDIADALADQPDSPLGVDPAPVDATADAMGGAITAELPETGSQAAEVSTVAGTLTMDVPAAGADLAPADDVTALFEGAAPDTAVAVPTHYQINGTTLAQIVEHHAGQYAYGIVAASFLGSASGVNDVVQRCWP